MWMRTRPLPTQSKGMGPGAVNSCVGVVLRDRSPTFENLQGVVECLATPRQNAPRLLQISKVRDDLFGLCEAPFS